MNVVDKLCLGTAQLGMKYGIKNDLGRQPFKSESFSILEKAIALGIKTFDTASIYGDAESILGEFGISSYSVRIVSKVTLSKAEKESSDIKALLEKKVCNSLIKLKSLSLDGYLLHDADDFYHEKIVDALLSLKRDGLVKHIGVSIYEEKDAIEVAKSRMMDYIQIPYNIFDQRLEHAKFFEYAQKNNLRIFTRSSFLQGLLLMRVDQIPSGLIRIKPYMEKLDAIINRYGYCREEAAFLYACSNEKIDQVVFGVETAQQLERNVGILNRIDGFNQCRKELNQSFGQMDKSLILPNLWSGVPKKID